ncbi:hypothetical protein AB5J56_18365 [Streptomyces sp. R21]|uniref:Polysaccharide deacetylase n=1 Tax=Streptomyces sp. R21 TaxID=3238627 RepID=A0AB39P664_9ACTN
MRPRVLAAALLTSALLAPLTGCAQSVDPIERLSKKAAQRVRPHTPPVTARHAAGPGRPQIIDHIPTRDRVVFLIYDGAPTPRFLTMTRELHLPVTLCAPAGCGMGPKTLTPRKNTAHLTPGTIIRADPTTTPALLRDIRSQGFAVASLKDYL